MQQTPGSVAAQHVLLTGPIRGTVTLEDGSVIDVTDGFVDVTHLSTDQVEEVAHRIGMRYFEEGHPDDVEVDPETNQLVQRPFEYQPPKRFAHELKGKKPHGTPHKTKKV